MIFTSRAEQYRWLTREAKLKTVSSGDYIRIRELGLFCLLETQMPHYDRATETLIRGGAVYQLLYLDKRTETATLIGPESHYTAQAALSSFVSNQQVLENAWIGQYQFEKPSLANLLTTPYTEAVVDARYCHHLFLEIKRQLIGYEFPDRQSDTVLDLSTDGRPILFSLSDLLEYKKGFCLGRISKKPFAEFPDIVGVEWILLDWTDVGFVLCEGPYAKNKLFFGEQEATLPAKEESFYRGSFKDKSFYQPVRGAIYAVPANELQLLNGKVCSMSNRVYEISLAIQQPDRR